MMNTQDVEMECRSRSARDYMVGDAYSYGEVCKFISVGMLVVVKAEGQYLPNMQIAKLFSVYKCSSQTH